MSISLIDRVTELPCMTELKHGPSRKWSRDLLSELDGLRRRMAAERGPVNVVGERVLEDLLVSSAQAEQARAQSDRDPFVV